MKDEFGFTKAERAKLYILARENKMANNLLQACFKYIKASEVEVGENFIELLRLTLEAEERKDQQETYNCLVCLQEALNDKF